MGCVMSTNNDNSSVHYIDDPSTSESAGEIHPLSTPAAHSNPTTIIMKPPQTPSTNPHRDLHPITIPTTRNLPLQPIPVITKSSYQDGLLHGRFVKERLLGQGAIAKVYTYLDPISNQQIAVKKFNRARLLSQKMYRNSGLSARLKMTTLWDKAENEIAVLQYLHSCGGGRPHSPILHHICPVYAIIDDPSLPHMFVLMEHGTNGIIADLDESGHQYKLSSLKTEQHGYRIYKQLLVMLEGLRRVGVIHNDIKPANLILDKDGGVKLIDFGEAIVIPTSHPELLHHSLNLQSSQLAPLATNVDCDHPISPFESDQQGDGAGSAIELAKDDLNNQPPNVVEIVSKLSDLFPESDNELSMSEDDEGSYEMAGLDNNGIFGTVDVDELINVKSKSKQAFSQQRVSITPNTFDSNSWYNLGTIHQGPGTPFFGNPDSAVGEYNGFDNDLWAAAVCLFVIVLGHLPFFSLQNNPQATIYASLQLIQTGQISWKSPFPKPIDASKEFKQFIETVMKPSPQLTLKECMALDLY